MGQRVPILQCNRGEGEKTRKNGGETDSRPSRQVLACFCGYCRTGASGGLGGVLPFNNYRLLGSRWPEAVSQRRLVGHVARHGVEIFLFLLIANMLSLYTLCEIISHVSAYLLYLYLYSLTYVGRGGEKAVGG